MLATYLLSGNNLINGLTNIAKQMGIIQVDSTMSYSVYDNSAIYDNDINTNNVKVLVSFNSDHGIEYIKKPDGTTINGNGKKSISLDYIIGLNEERTFRVKGKNGQEKESILKVTQEEINNTCNIEVVPNGNLYKNNISFNTLLEPQKMYFKVENDKWREYTGSEIKIYSVFLDDSTITDNKIDMVNISFKLVDRAGNQLYINKSEDMYITKVHVIVSDGILKNTEYTCTGYKSSSGYYSSSVTQKDGYVEIYLDTSRMAYVGATVAWKVNMKQPAYSRVHAEWSAPEIGAQDSGGVALRATTGPNVYSNSYGGVQLLANDEKKVTDQRITNLGLSNMGTSGIFYVKFDIYERANDSVHGVRWRKLRIYNLFIE